MNNKLYFLAKEKVFCEIPETSRGVLLIALSLKILLHADIAVANLLPALVVVVLTGGVARLGWKI